MNKQAPTSLKEAIQNMTPQDSSVIMGKVTSASPLKIQAVNDDKLTIHGNLLCIPKHLTDYTVKCNIPEIGLSNAEITINNALKSGETVYLLRFNKNKKYYVLDREG
jgi:hypothetical protein